MITGPATIIGRLLDLAERYMAFLERKNELSAQALADHRKYHEQEDSGMQSLADAIRRYEQGGPVPSGVRVIPLGNLPRNPGDKKD